MEIKAYCNKNNKVMNIFFESEINNIPPEKIKKNELKECKNLEKLLKKYINGKEVNFKKYYDLSFVDLQILLASEIHEQRLSALLILVDQYQKNIQNKSDIVQFYLKNTQYYRNCNDCGCLWFCCHDCKN